jgi:hypothetical protein
MRRVCFCGLIVLMATGCDRLKVDPPEVGLQGGADRDGTIADAGSTADVVRDAFADDGTVATADASRGDDAESGSNSVADASGGAMRVTEPALFPAGAHLALWSTTTLQKVLVVGTDGATWSCGARDYIYAPNTWEPPHAISAAHLFAPGAPLVAHQRFAGLLDLFLVGVDGGFWCGGFQNVATAPTVWGTEYSIGATGIFDPSTTVVAFSQDVSHTRISAFGRDGTLRNSAWPTVLGQNTWTDVEPVPDASAFGPSTPLAAAFDPNGGIELFAVDDAGQVRVPSRFDLDSGLWGPAATPPTSVGVPASAPVAPLVRTPGLLDLYVTNEQGGTENMGSVVPASAWSPGYPVSSVGLFPAGAVIATVARTTACSDLFAIGADGAIYSAGSWQLTQNDGRWLDATALTPAGLFPPGAPLAAGARDAETVDVFAIGVDGALWTTTVIRSD